MQLRQKQDGGQECTRETMVTRARTYDLTNAGPTHSAPTLHSLDHFRPQNVELNYLSKTIFFFTKRFDVL